MRPLTPPLFALALLPAVAAAQAPAQPPVLAVDAARSTLTYNCVHKLHKFAGVSKQVEGRARLLDGGKVQVEVKAPVASFDSANANRDAHMKETVEAARCPTVELKAVGELAWAATFPATVEKTFKGQLLFHCEKQALDLPVKITFESATTARVQAQLAVGLERFKIERPSLLFVKVDDAMKVDVDLVFQR